MLARAIHGKKLEKGHVSNRIDLSADTHIETMDGRWYLITENLTISIDWPERHVEGACCNPSDGDWFEMGLDEDWGASVIWRILLTDVAPVYECVDGEPWAIDEGHIILCGLVFWDWDDMRGEKICRGPLPEYYTDRLMHRRAAAVCDGAEQFRALHAALKEARINE